MVRDPETNSRIERPTNVFRAAIVGEVSFKNAPDRRNEDPEVAMQVTTLTTDGDNSLLAGLRSTLQDADSALLCVAFIRSAGVHLLHRQLEALGSATRLLLTTTFSENSSALTTAHRLGTSLAILNPGSGTYHPKIYLARRGLESIAVIGSANLTGGLASNVEAAVLLRGTETDEPIKAAWEFGERLWANPRSSQWSPTGTAVVEETFEPALFDLLVAVVETHHGVFTTLDQGKPNRVMQPILPTGLYVETEASRAKGNPPQLIPAWIFT